MATTSTVRKHYRNIRPVTRCGNRSAKQVESGTTGANYNGFLNHAFKPFYHIPETNWRKTEREFFHSLSNLCGLYRWAIPDVSHLDYPLNVATAFDIISVKCKEQKLNCIIAKDNVHTTSITTVKTYDTGRTLYYIPVRPVWLLLQSQAQPILTEIWLMLFRYLYHINGVTYYRQDGFLQRMYEILQNWVDEDCDSEDKAYKREQQETIDALQNGGDMIYTHLRQEFNAKQLQQLLRRYRKSGYYETKMDKIATDCLQLCRDYPNRSINQSIVSGLITTDYDETIYLDNILSFFWSSSDCLYDSLMEMINNEFMEMSYQEEPVSLQSFGKRQAKEIHNFDFETRFFSLMEDISEVLNQLESAQSEGIILNTAV